MNMNINNDSNERVITPLPARRGWGVGLFIVVIALVYGAFTIVFDTFPRSTISELERRELATFPAFSWEKLADGSFTRDVSSWFSDSEPYRDHFMQLSMTIKDLIALKTGGEEQVKFHAAAPMEGEEPLPEEFVDPEAEANRTVGNYENKVTANEKTKIAHAGIIIVGSGDKVRALMAYGGGPEGGVQYAEAANKYKRVFGSDVNVYCMVIPTAAEFYCPEEARKSTKPQAPTINNIYAHLDDSVKAVDIYTSLGQHANEDIYLRTDHHWAPRGAFYAARKFAKVAGVPFRELDSYDRHVVHGFVGTMYGYSKDISVKNAPEDFVYWTPRDVDYTTTYINYTIDKQYKVTGESHPVQGKYFFEFKDGSSGAYCTFMGGDSKITQVRTGNPNHRRLIILKDSFGNAIPGYLFYSFEEIHVIDSRYFTKNMKDYVRDNKITDILFANNIFMAYSFGTCQAYEKFLNQ